MKKNIANSTPSRKFGDAEKVTILTCSPGYTAAKRHTLLPDGKRHTEGFNAGKFFDCKERDVSDIHELHAILVEEGETHNKLIIRGRRNPNGPRRIDGQVRRNSRPDATAGETEPGFLEQPRSWVVLDFDKFENPDGVDPTTPEAMADLRTRLPPEFQDVTCSYALSSSAGLSDTDRISGHLTFYLDRPVGSPELKVWLRQCGVDTNLFQAVQPHYIAPPVFDKGLLDPVSQRKGLLEGGSDVVTVPEIDTSRPTFEYRGEGRGLEMAHGYEAKIALLGDGDGKEGCHGVITPAIASYMASQGSRADREALKADIRQRAAAAPWDRSKHSEEYVAREVSDEVMDRSIQDWVDKTVVRCEGYAPSEMDDVDVARTKQERAVGYFVSQALRWQENHDYRQALIKKGSIGFIKIDKRYVFNMYPPPRHGLSALVGLGKTAAYTLHLEKFVSALRKGHCVVVSVPNHKLSRELERRVRERGIDAEIYLGPAQDDPDQSDKTMCWIPDKLATFQTAGIAETLCKVCPHRQQCGFQKQRQKKAKVWIGAHQLLYRKRNKSIPPVDFLIVDEDPVAAGLEGDNPQQPLVLQSDEVPDDVREAIERLTLGVSFSRADFDVSDRRLRELISLTFAQMRKVKLTQEQEIDDAVTMAQANSKLVKEAEFYRAILNDGPWGMRAYKLMDGLVELKWLRQRRVHGDFDVPMLFADATAQWDAVRHIIDCYQSPPGYKGEPWIDEDGSVAIDYDYPLDPVIGPITDVKAQTPHTSYRQVLFSGAASKFKGEETGANNVARVRRYIEARSVGFERGLLICQQSLESKLLELGLPPNVETAHFNNIRGRDEWKDIDLLIVVGRIQPPPGAMELNAEVLFRAECKTLGPEYYDRVRTPLTGTDEEVDAERHPDPLAELVRWCACEAELIQAIGRGRGVNRTEADPLQVDLINKVPLPDIKIDEVVTWDDAQPDPGAVIAGRYGLRLAERSSKGTANVVAALLPDLFDTASAARQARVYSQAETPNRYTLLGVSACEYTAADDSHAGSLIAIRAPDCRYAVIAYTERALIRRPLEQGEAPPNGADIDADGVLMVGPVYVLKQIPRRLKSKCGRRRTPDTENNPAL